MGMWSTRRALREMDGHYSQVDLNVREADVMTKNLPNLPCGVWGRKVETRDQILQKWSNNSLSPSGAL